MSGRHLVLGRTTDFLTGRTVVDTLDERIRQNIARFLVENRGFGKEEIESRISLPVTVDGDTETVVIDFAVRIGGKTLMIVRFGPGSLVSRQRATIAAARLMERDYMVPWAVITNGEDAHLMDTRTEDVLGTGMEAIFSRRELLAKTGNAEAVRISEKRREKESRILFALDVLSRRECESYTCRQC